MHHTREGRSGRPSAAASAVPPPDMPAAAPDEPAEPSRSQSGYRKAGTVAAGLSLLLAAACASAPAPPEPSEQSASSSPATKPEKPSERPRAVGDPVRLRIPAVGLSTEIIPLRLDGKGKLIAPKRFDVVGWHRAGPEPGERGTAVVAGHVDSRSGPAVFYRLSDLAPGTRVHVDTDRGQTFTFTVTRLERHPKSDVPDSVYRPSRTPELRLITCGGSFDQTRRSYRDNIIVHATLAR
ncbi:class F sortase [Actinocorallia sp. API 0066]|uniref:class F sortase n=1 Tax=Actinocorallia sp. API 0066 TaxID=2896846 RepID=UPI001E5B9D77|nr:class F sortase [Actinocorallia sp. API 0066]MCD0452033.1 class F sortase [Actinocorallia sp. API 0066]